MSWREAFIRTFLRRDIAQLGVQIPPITLRRLWMMLAHYHGQVWNASEVSRSLGEAHTTVKRHLDVLTAAFMVRQLQPWFANIGKRQVRSPKVFVRDSGILHALLGLPTFKSLDDMPNSERLRRGGFVLEQAVLAAGERNAFYGQRSPGPSSICFSLSKASIMASR